MTSVTGQPPRTMLDKIWDAHEIRRDEEGSSLLLVARQMAHDGSCHAFDFLKQRGMKPRRPDQIFATPDHGVPTFSHRREDISDPEQRRVVDTLEDNARQYSYAHFGLGDRRQGIVHVIGPELGITQPGLVMVCGDSHTSTHGALGALAFGIGASDVCHVLATQTIWQRRPMTMRVTVDGALAAGVTSKDVIMAIIARIGANGGQGHVIEYAGEAIRAMSVEARLTVCNMSIEAGARAGMVAPDDDLPPGSSLAVM